jgi:hypothetical protein
MNNTLHSDRPEPETYPQFLNRTWREVRKAVRRFLIRRELAAIRYECGCIERQRRDDLEIERLLHGREVALRSELNDL